MFFHKSSSNIQCLIFYRKLEDISHKEENTPNWFLWYKVLKKRPTETDS